MLPTSTSTVPSVSHQVCTWYERCHQRYYSQRCVFILLGSIFASTARYLSIGTLLVRAVTHYALRARVVIVSILVSVRAHIIRDTCFYLFLRTRSRAGGTRDRERGATILCVRTVVFCTEDRGPLHAVYHAAYSSSSPLPQIGVLVRWRGPQISKYGTLMFRFVLASSCRTKGPFIYF